MPTVRLRLIGSDTVVDSLFTGQHGLDGVAYIEQVAGLMAHVGDEDSRSVGLFVDIGAGVHAIRIEVHDQLPAYRVRDLAGTAAAMLAVAVDAF